MADSDRLNSMVRSINAINDKLRTLEKRYVSKETANDSVILQSPNKSVWEIKVSDAGAITATKVSG